MEKVVIFFSQTKPGSSLASKTMQLIVSGTEI
jgi:hypothetical protein